jgi:low temperature requirement protein LtrA
VIGGGAKISLLRARDGHGTAPVTQIELFFDLVFVFAITQLSQDLRTHLDPLGVLHAAILLAAVWWSWVCTSWITNWLDPDEQPVRLLLIALMLAGLALSISLPRAFSDRALVFAAAYVAMQLIRSVFMLWAVKNFDQSNYRNVQRFTLWFCLSAIFWIAGALLPAWRLYIWLAALALDIGAPAIGFWVPGLGRSATADWQIDSFHLAERCGGFILIALGESLTVTGETFSTEPWNAANSAAFLAAFLGSVALWWIYFDTAAERLSHAFAKSEDPGRVARAAYTYMHAVLVAGIIVAAAADELALVHPADKPSLGAALVTLGGPALYLIGNGIFRRMLAPKFPPSHLLGLVLLAALAVAAPYLNLLALAGATTATVVIVAAVGAVLHRRQMHHA